MSTIQVLQRKWKPIECPTCKQTGCYKHCNFCGIDIKWLNYLGNPYYEINRYGRRVRYTYEMDDTVHRCMKKGQGKFIQNKQEAIIEKKCKWCNSTKQTHDSFWNDLVILEKDNWMVVAEKKKRQRKLRNFDYINSLIRYPVPPSWYSYSFEY